MIPDSVDNLSILWYFIDDIMAHFGILSVNGSRVRDVCVCLCELWERKEEKHIKNVNDKKI